MKKIISIITIVALLMSYGMIARAEDQIISQSGTATVEIIADISSTFEVNIPDLVQITEREVKEFEITGNGNIASTEYLEITMPNTVKMSANNKEDVDLALTIDDNKFTSEELASDGGAIANCSIDASTISSGSWTGSVDVTIELKENTD